MFTGIIEKLGTVTNIESKDTNLIFTVRSEFTNELKIDQSVAHNGVCLTVISEENDEYRVEAIKETLDRTNLIDVRVGDHVNLERCLLANQRLDGHIVQGHVDQVGECKKIEDLNGSWKFYFEYDVKGGNVTVEKGSVCINGVSLTVVDSFEGGFSVAIIPYTYEHTNFKNFTIGSKVNLEFDIVGKYVSRLTKGYL